MVDNIPIHPSSSAAETIEQTFKKYSTVALVALAACFAGWGAIRFIRHQKEAEVGEAWRSFSKVEPNTLRPQESNAAIESVPDALRPWARLVAANRPLTTGVMQPDQLLEAKPAFEKLAAEVAGSPAAAGLVPDVMGAKPVSASIDAFVAWEKANPQFLENPAPSPAEKVRFVTDAGTFEVAFYPDAAPEHVKNFKQLAKDHFYEKTKFHRVTKGGTSIVQGGDPNTIDGPKEKWGQGSKGDGIPVEGNKLVHVRGAVAMAQPSTPTPDKKSSGCQFYIVTKGSHNLDGNYTVFGTVVSGMDVVDKIAAGEIEPGTDRPLTPVMVTKTEIF